MGRKSIIARLTKVVPITHFEENLGYRTKRVGFVVTFRLFGAEKSVLKLVGANLKDGQNVLVLWRLFGLLVRENPH